MSTESTPKKIEQNNALVWKGLEAQQVRRGITYIFSIGHFLDIRGNAKWLLTCESPDLPGWMRSLGVQHSVVSAKQRAQEEANRL